MFRDKKRRVDMLKDVIHQNIRETIRAISWLIYSQKAKKIEVVILQKLN